MFRVCASGSVTSGGFLRKKRTSPEIAIGCNNGFGIGSLCYEMADHAPNPETCYAQNEKQRILRTAIRRLRPNLQGVAQIQLQGRSMAGNSRNIRYFFVSSQRTTVPRQEGPLQVGHHEAGGPASICQQAMCLAPGTRRRGGRANKVPRLRAVELQEERRCACRCKPRNIKT